MGQIMDIIDINALRRRIAVVQHHYDHPPHSGSYSPVDTWRRWKSYRKLMKAVSRSVTDYRFLTLHELHICRKAVLVAFLGRHGYLKCWWPRMILSRIDGVIREKTHG